VKRITNYEVTEKGSNILEIWRAKWINVERERYSQNNNNHVYGWL